MWDHSHFKATTPCSHRTMKTAVLMPVPAPLAATHGPSAAARKGVAAAARRTHSSIPNVSVRLRFAAAVFQEACASCVISAAVNARCMLSCVGDQQCTAILSGEPSLSTRISSPSPVPSTFHLEDDRLDATDQALRLGHGMSLRGRIYCNEAVSTVTVSSRLQAAVCY
jgi:hypothetical protein